MCRVRSILLIEPLAKLARVGRRLGEGFSRWNPKTAELEQYYRGNTLVNWPFAGTVIIRSFSSWSVYWFRITFFMKEPVYLTYWSTPLGQMLNLHCPKTCRVYWKKLRYFLRIPAMNFVHSCHHFWCRIWIMLRLILLALSAQSIPLFLEKNSVWFLWKRSLKKLLC